MPPCPRDERSGLALGREQKPAVFWLVIRPTKQKPRKLAHVKRIASYEQLGLTCASVAVDLPWPD
jgi:hypothetical protein